ncbi:MAG: GatB/YqeY domain-containing protein [bacterium]|nr:GatB/YqeY domain-containing protein [bacterium]
MSIYESIEAKIPEALRAHDEVQLRTLRSLFAAMTNVAITKHAHSGNTPVTASEAAEIKADRSLTDEEALEVLRLAANQRKDSIQMFERGGRNDLIGPERDELRIIESYLPTQMSREQVKEVVEAKLIELKVSSKAESGKLIGVIMKDLKGKADGAVVKEIVDSLLE